ncbi:uncharacterized protein LOC144357573 [Saccoglossus kowalevskii]
MTNRAVSQLKIKMTCAEVFVFILFLYCSTEKTCAWPNSCTFRSTLSRQLSRSIYVSYASRYSTGCGFWNFWDSCTRYRTAYKYQQQYYTEYYYSYYQEDCEGYCDSYQCNGRMY